MNCIENNNKKLTAMKLISILSILLLFIASNFANASTISFSSFEGKSFWLIINGVYINNSPATQVGGIQVEDDFVRVKIIFNNRKGTIFTQEIDTRPFSPRDREKSFIIKMMGHGVYKIVPKHRERRGMNHNQKRPQGTTTNKSHSHHNHAVTKQIMPTYDYNLLNENLHKSAFDKDKLPMAKLAIRPYLITVSQIRGLSCSFNFGKSRLAFIKYAYNNTIDKEQFYTLADVFDFPSQKNDFFNFLAQRQ